MAVLNWALRSFTNLSSMTSSAGWVAQSVEQRTENPCVGGSIPPPATIFETPNQLRACLKNAFGVPPLGGTAWEPPKGGTPNLRLRIFVGFFRHALRKIEGSFDSRSLEDYTLSAIDMEMDTVTQSVVGVTPGAAG